MGDGFNVVCSDATAMLEQTHDFIELMDGEVVVVVWPIPVEPLTSGPTKARRSAIRPFSLTKPAGNAVEREPFHIDMDPQAAKKGAYPYYMLKEIS